MAPARNGCGVRRRQFVAAVPTLLLAAGTRAQYPPVVPGRALAFPRDHGAHPAYRSEWWYITGWLRDGRGSELGMQITFFRNRPLLQEANPSAFAPKQLLFAHAALGDPRQGRLLHDQRAARAGFGLAEADTATTRVRIDDWSLALEGDVYSSRIASRAFEMNLRFSPTQPLLLQGQSGVSRKGPDPRQASYYYSRPQLSVSGAVRIGDTTGEVAGRAWLDHEWSSEYLAPEAEGWDWTGINFDDGRALMAFRIRANSGDVFWAAATLRQPDGTTQHYRGDQVAFTPLRRWRSPRTDVEYPVAMRVKAGSLELDLLPLMDDQELDSRASTGTIYWEGAVRAVEGGTRVGRGYLELTGYWTALKL